jgi:hypothetical protein
MPGRYTPFFRIEHSQKQTVKCSVPLAGEKVCIQNFRVLFCPVLMMITNVRIKDKQTGKPVTITTKNHPQRALRGIHIGLPRHNSGWLVFVPSNNTIYHSIDVYFDEHFESTIAFENNRYPGYIDCVITDAQAHEDLNVERTGSALWFSNKKQLPNGSVIQHFAQPQVQEEYDIDLLPYSTINKSETSFEESVTTTDRSLGEEEDPTHYTHYTPSTEQEDPTHNTPITPSTELYVPTHMSTKTDDNDADARSTMAVAPRYFTRQQAKLQNPFSLPPPDELTQHVEHAYLTEVTLPSQGSHYIGSVTIPSSS